MNWVIDDRLKLCQVRIAILAKDGVVCTDVHDFTDEIVARLAHIEFLNYLTFQSQRLKYWRIDMLSLYYCPSSFSIQIFFFTSFYGFAKLQYFSLLEEIFGVIWDLLAKKTLNALFMPFLYVFTHNRYNNVLNLFKKLW